MDSATLIGMSHETYELIEKLGEGGFGEVYLARKNPLKKLVALKLLQHTVSPTAERRLWNEAMLLASLHHPSILAAEDLVRLDGRLGLVTEYIEGEDLSTCLDDGMPASALVEVVAQVAWGLHAAAQKGVVHRDVKPQNVRIGRHGNVKLLDFGIAFADSPERGADLTQGMIGTPRYMAPERFRFEFAPASDVFSLGCVLWLGLEGTHFYGECSTFEQIVPFTRSEARWNALLSGAFRENLPRDLEELLRAMLARDVRDRPSAADVARRCEALLERWPDRKRLGEWCRERWPDGVAVPNPSQTERTTSSLVMPGERASCSEDDLTEDAATDALETDAVAPARAQPKAPPTLNTPKTGSSQTGPGRNRSAEISASSLERPSKPKASEAETSRARLGDIETDRVENPPPLLPTLQGRTISPVDPTIARPSVKPPREGGSWSLVGLSLGGLSISALALAGVVIAAFFYGTPSEDGSPPTLAGRLFGWEIPKARLLSGQGTSSSAATGEGSSLPGGSLPETTAAGAAEAGNAEAGNAEAGSAEAGSAEAGSAEAGSAEAGSADGAPQADGAREPAGTAASPAGTSKPPAEAGTAATPAGTSKPPGTPEGQKPSASGTPSAAETPEPKPAKPSGTAQTAPAAPRVPFATRDGALTDPVAIREMISGRLSELTGGLETCYTERAKEAPSLMGRWRLSFSVLSSGEVGDVAVSALDKPDAALESCIVSRVRSGWRFSAISQAQPVTRTLRFP